MRAPLVKGCHGLVPRQRHWSDRGLHPVPLTRHGFRSHRVPGVLAKNARTPGYLLKPLSRRRNIQSPKMLPARSCPRQRMRRDSRHFLQGDPVMKRLISVAIIVASLGAAACTTAVVVRPPRAGLVLVNGRWVVAPRAGAVWIAPHWERRGYQRVWIEGFWRY